MFKCLIRCDSSQNIGQGHLVRCLSLANKLVKKKGWAIEFAVSYCDYSSIKKISQQGFKVNQPIKIPTNSKEEEEWLKLLLKKNDRYDCIIFDIRNNFSNAFFTFISAKNIKIFNIDDPTNKRLYSDINLYPPLPEVFDLEWKNFKGINKIGWEYIILREEFIKNKKLNIIPESIMITAGGSDPLNVTCLIINSIKRLALKNKLNLSIVIGPNFIFHDELNKILTPELTYKVYKDIDAKKFINLIDQCLFGIISFGTTAFEFIARGKPSIHLCISESHSRCSNMISNMGLSQTLGNIENLNPKQIEDKTNKLLLDKDLRNNLVNKTNQISKHFSQDSIVDVLDNFLKNN